MTEQEITTLLEGVRQSRPHGDPHLREATTYGYRRYGHGIRFLRTMAACAALALIAMATMVFVPNPRYGFVEGAATAKASCQQIDKILTMS